MLLYVLKSKSEFVDPEDSLFSRIQNFSKEQVNVAVTS
jgi:hypothetical protein